MKVLIIGRGGREHALAWKVSQSPLVDKVYTAPGNVGIAQVSECIPIQENDFNKLLAFAKEKAIDLTIVGPEQPLVDGIVDLFLENGLSIFGPTQQAAQIEGSKTFAKSLMEKYGIPTAAYQSFSQHQDAVDYVKKQGAPLVIKADGLAAGKGVTVALTEEEAVLSLDEMMQEKRFGDASQQVVIEEFLSGEEFSLMAFVDGESVFPLVIAQDHKRAYEGDQGPNTGGMGAYSPVPQISEAVVNQAVETILKPTAKALVQEGCSFTGLLYAGLMLTVEGPKVIEFNARFGDPETQVVLPRLATDLVKAMVNLTKGEAPLFEWNDEAVCGVVLASGGYPGNYSKGIEINGIGELDDDSLVFHAGTTSENGTLQTNGGRILLVASVAKSLKEACDRVQSEMKKIKCDSAFYRTDIGYRALNQTKNG